MYLCADGRVPVGRVGRAGIAVLVAEHEVVGGPSLADFVALSVLHGLVRRESSQGTRFGRTSERF